jgi:hypothetical protein
MLSTLLQFMSREKRRSTGALQKLAQLTTGSKQPRQIFCPFSPGPVMYPMKT